MAQEGDAQPKQDASRPVLHVVDRDAKTSYANVCLLSGTREEMILSFGLSFPPASRDNPEHQLLVSNRVIMSLPAAKRLAIALSQTLQRYEGTYGSIDLGHPPHPQVG